MEKSKEKFEQLTSEEMIIGIHDPFRMALMRHKRQVDYFTTIIHKTNTDKRG